MTIRELRARTGWTQRYFAEYFGVPRRTFEDWESGRNRCPDYLRKLIQYKLFKEGIIMNNKITYKYTNNYDESTHDNGFGCDTDYIVTDGVYDFEDYLQDNEVRYEVDSDLYFIVDQDGERTGEAYMVVSEEPTDEDIT